MFTAKHYERIVKVLKESDAAPRVVLAFTELFKQDNPKFEEGRFIESVYREKKHI